jgi:leucyl aminopeptidase
LKISFASQRPAGAYALAIPLRSEDMLNERLSGLPEASRSLAARAAEAQRFEREAASVAEVFIDDGAAARRVLLIGLGAVRNDDALYEKVGGTLVGRLLTSGETRLVIDASGLGLDADAAARIGFGAAARAWRHDQYRTRLSSKQRPTLEEW